MTGNAKVISLCQERDKRKQLLADQQDSSDIGFNIELDDGGKLVVTDDYNKFTLTDADGTVFVDGEYLDSQAQLIALRLISTIRQLEMDAIEREIKEREKGE